MGNKQRMSTQQQAEFFKLLGDLLTNGFTLLKSLDFMLVTVPKQHRYIQQLMQILKTGKPLSAGFMEVGIQQEIITQLILAEKHGNVEQTLSQIGEMLAIRQKRMQELQQLLSYPVFIICSIIGLIVGMKSVLGSDLISMSDQHTQQTNPAALILLGILSLFVLALMVTVSTLCVKDRLTFVQRIIKIPLIGPVFRQYYYFTMTLQFGMLLKNGLLIQDILQVFLTLPTKSLAFAVANKMNPKIAAGEALNITMADIGIFPPEMILFFQKGSDTAHLGDELLIFSGYCYKRMNNQLQKLFGMIQPILFLLIGLAIISLYWQILMPIYDLMNGVF